MNSIEAALIGRVASETIEARTSAGGKLWTAFNVAVGDADSVQWVRVSVFGERAERLAAELKKGDKLYIDGHSLRLSEWVGRDGEKRSGLQMVGAKVEKIGAGAIGQNRSRKSKPAGETKDDQARPSNGAKDWQRPLDDSVLF
jgi:single-stranded DNA-binding protein